MKKYSSYKDSGIDWLDEIPTNWSRSRIRMVGDLYGGLTGKKGDDFNNEENPSNKPFVPFTNIFNNTYISKDHFQLVNVEEGEKQNLVLKNDLFFLMSSESYEDLGKCSILLEDVEELYLNSFCKGYRIKDNRVYPLFLNYQLLGSLHKEMISIEGNGFTRINLRQDRLLDIPVFIPPYSEQQRIVEFLDNKTTKIDDLIQHKEKKIELLQEKRTSLINHVVTKGLNPNVEFKDSGVEWIGEIPSEWTLTPLKRLVEIGNGRDYKHIEVDEGGYPVYGTGGEFSRCTEYLHQGPSVLLGRKGTINNPLFVKEPFWTSDTIYFTIIDETKVLPELLFYLVHQIPFDLYSYGSTIPSMTKSDYENMKFPIPSKTVQNEIVNYLKEQTKEIDDLIQLEKNKIELLREYRKSLISEVVTGKVRVCEEDLSETVQIV